MYRNAISKKLGIFTEFKKKILQTYILRDDKKVKVETIHELLLQKRMRI
jgi:cytidine deaminase